MFGMTSIRIGCWESFRISSSMIESTQLNVSSNELSFIKFCRSEVVASEKQGKRSINDFMNE